MSHKKTILFLINRECFFLPPFMSLMEVLCEEYSIKVISYETIDSFEKIRDLYKGRDIEFLSGETQPVVKTLGKRIRRRLKRGLGIKGRFHKEAINILNVEQYDLLWIIHEKTLDEFKGILKDRRYVVSLYELNDNDRPFLDRIKKPLQCASEIIVPEYNRANILRVWENLSETPTVLPNKPVNHPGQKNIPNRYSDLLEGKKIILYQGYIQKSRNLDAICEACIRFPEYTLLLLGTGDSGYIRHLKETYPQVIHIPFVVPPAHLHITSYARIGIVKYDFVSLNAVFCAPNKTWEYTGFGIPVLAHDIPGLQDSVGRYNAGVCCNLDKTDEIQEAISIIDREYPRFEVNAKKFYESVNVIRLIKEIAERNL